MTPRFRRLNAALILGLSLCGAQQSVAHKDDYIDETLVYLTVERGDWELEYWFDLGTLPSIDNQEAQLDFIRHNLAVEHGITDHLMLDSRLTLDKVEGEATEFESARLEGRLRFGEEGEHPIDIAASAEVNTERNDDGDQVFGLEPRLILSKDFRTKLNVTLNLPLEVQPGPGSVEFLPAAGLRFNAFESLRLGLEVSYGTESGEGKFVPQIWFAPTEGLIIKAAYAVGFDANEQNFTRIAIETEF